MSVIEFPARVEPQERRVRGIFDCLDYLQAEAQSARLPWVAHLVGAAREAAREELEALQIGTRR